MEIMKKLFLMTVLSSFFVCNGFAKTSDQHDEPIVLNKEGGKIAIGKVEKSGKVNPLVDLKQLKEVLLQEGFLQEIETIDLSEHYFTIIGKEANNFALQAYQIELVRSGDTLYLLDDNDNVVVIKHSCAATASNADCNFKRNKKDKILGCKNNGATVCNHTIASKEINIFNEQIKKILKEII